MIHPTHKTRTSDASSFDTICDLCGATDRYCDFTELSKPCPAKDKENKKVKEGKENAT